MAEDLQAMYEDAKRAYNRGKAKNAELNNKIDRLKSAKSKTSDYCDDYEDAFFGGIKKIVYNSIYGSGRNEEWVGKTQKTYQEKNDAVMESAKAGQRYLEAIPDGISSAIWQYRKKKVDLDVLWANVCDLGSQLF